MRICPPPVPLLLAFGLLLGAVPARSQTLDLNGQLGAMLCDRGSPRYNAEACEGLTRDSQQRNPGAPVARATDPAGTQDAALRQRLERERQSMAARPPRVLGRPGDPSAVPLPSGGPAPGGTSERPGAMPHYAGTGCTYARARPGGASHGGGATSACDKNARGSGGASYGPPPNRR